MQARSWQTLTVVAATALGCCLTGNSAGVHAGSPRPALISASFDPNDPPKPLPLLQPAEVLPAPASPSVPANPPAKPKNSLLPEETPIGKVGTDIVAKGDLLPKNLAVGYFNQETDAFAYRPWMGQVYHWDAPALCFGPLRYEEINLERYGYGRRHCIQPVVSAAHFIGSTLALPYSMAVHPCHECIYPLGHYRPGSPVPYQPHWPQWRPGAGAVEAAAVVGLVFLIP